MAEKSTRLGLGVAVVAAVVGLVVFAVVRFLFFGLDEATPWDKPARVADGQVDLTYEGRDCRDRVDVDVEEDATTVVITIRESVRALVCGDDERTSYDVSVSLDAPLGDRELVDGACRLGSFTEDERCASGVVTAVG